MDLIWEIAAKLRSSPCGGSLDQRTQHIKYRKHLSFDVSRKASPFVFEMQYAVREFSQTVQCLLRRAVR